MENQNRLSKLPFCNAFGAWHSWVSVHSSDYSFTPSTAIANGELARRLPSWNTYYDEPNEVESYTHRIKLNILKDERLSLDIDDPKIYTLRGRFPDGYMNNHLPHIAYNLGERVRQSLYRLVTIHAAGVTDHRGRSILILGDKGSGKTSLALTLGLDRGYSLIGNDLILIRYDNQTDKITLADGTRIFDIRAPVMKRILPDMPSKEEGHPYEDKTTFYPEELGIKCGKDTQGLKVTVRINIHEGQKPHITEGPKYNIEVLRTRENLGRYIRGQVFPLTMDARVGFGYFPSLDTEELNHFRNQLLGSLLSKRFFNISCGSAREAMELLDAIF